jgi:hypothetical protein
MKYISYNMNRYQYAKAMNLQVGLLSACCASCLFHFIVYSSLSIRARRNLKERQVRMVMTIAIRLDHPKETRASPLAAISMRKKKAIARMKVGKGKERRNSLRSMKFLFIYLIIIAYFSLDSFVLVLIYLPVQPKAKATRKRGEKESQGA